MNEPFLKGGKAQPVIAGQMFLALQKGLTEAGVTIPLGWPAYGDYSPDGGKTWSQVAGGNGYDADAVHGVPGLAAAIKVIISHPYGPAGANKENDWGPGALKVQLTQLQSLGVEVKAIYATEFGIEWTPGLTGFSSAPTEQATASEIEGAVKELITIPHMDGLWPYTLHDTAGQKWGFVGGTWEPRPSLADYVKAA
jgi:hypothetical protein